MKCWIFAISCIVSLQVRAQSLVEVRESFHKAVLDSEQSRAFHDFLKDANPATPTVKAYKAASEAMLARVVWNPFTKLSQVMKCAALMEIAIAEDQENIEIRFLRLAVEYNLPRFLGMSKHLIEDRDTIVRNMASIGSLNLNTSFSRFIIYFLKETELCNEEEIALMTERLKEVNQEKPLVEKQ